MLQERSRCLIAPRDTELEYFECFLVLTLSFEIHTQIHSRLTMSLLGSAAKHLPSDIRGNIARSQFVPQIVLR
ncbi:hypothetical protein D3C84_1250820 [compost metagenome]